MTGGWPDQRFGKVGKVESGSQIDDHKTIIMRGSQVAKHKATIPQNRTIDGRRRSRAEHRIVSAQGEEIGMKPDDLGMSALFRQI